MFVCPWGGGVGFPACITGVCIKGEGGLHPGVRGGLHPGGGGLHLGEGGVCIWGKGGSASGGRGGSASGDRGVWIQGEGSEYGGRGLHPGGRGSVSGGGGSALREMVGKTPQDTWDTRGYGQQVGSTHPTGMHSF